MNFDKRVLGFSKFKPDRDYSFNHAILTDMSNDNSRSSADRPRSTSSSPDHFSNPGLDTHFNLEDDTIAQQDSSGNRLKRARITFSKEQVQTLSAAYERNCYPSANDYADMAHALNVPCKNLKTWFHNKRQQTRKGRSFSKNNLKTSSSELPNISPTLVLPFGRLPPHQGAALFHKKSPTASQGDNSPPLISRPPEHRGLDTIKDDQFTKHQSLGNRTTTEAARSKSLIETPTATARLPIHQVTQSTSETEMMSPLPVLSKGFLRQRQMRSKLPLEMTVAGQSMMDTTPMSQYTSTKLPSHMTYSSHPSMTHKLPAVQGTRSWLPVGLISTSATQPITNNLPASQGPRAKSPITMPSPSPLQPISGSLSSAPTCHTKSPTKRPSSRRTQLTANHLLTHQNTLQTFSTARTPSTPNMAISDMLPTFLSPSEMKPQSTTQLTIDKSPKSYGSFSNQDVTSPLCEITNRLPHQSTPGKASTPPTEIVTEKSLAQNTIEPSSPLQLEVTLPLCTQQETSQICTLQSTAEKKYSTSAMSVSAQQLCKLPPKLSIVDMSHPIENFPHHMYPCVTSYVGICVS